MKYKFLVELYVGQDEALDIITVFKTAPNALQAYHLVAQDYPQNLSITEVK